MKRQFTYIALATLALTLALVAPLSAQTDAAEAERLAKFKAVFIYNFIEYVRWPETKQEGPIIVGVLGKSDITPYLQRIVAKRKADKRAIAIEVYETAKGDFSACHILYAPTAFDKGAELLEKKLTAAHVLSIGETPGAAKKWASINFTLAEGKLKFEINTATLERAQLYMSSHLLRLGLLVK